MPCPIATKCALSKGAEATMIHQSRVQFDVNLRGANKMAVQNDFSPTEEFVSLIAVHQRTIFLYLNSLVPSSAEVDDLFQETCLVCWREFDKFEEGTNFAAWACTIAFNRVRAWRSSQSRQRVVFSDAFLESVAQELADNQELLEDRSKVLRQCIGKLPEHHRELVRLRYTAEHSIAAIADRLEKSTDSIYRMLSRIRVALHRCVTETLNQESQSTELPAK